jgi:MFS family permease
MLAIFASRIGLVKTMVFTHLPSNVLLTLVPLMPNLSLAILVLLLRFSISQMDVPTRQSYTMAIVQPEERSATAGLTGVARTTGAAIAPLFAGMLFARPSLINLPFFIAGTLKIGFDLLLYRTFVRMEPPDQGSSPQDQIGTVGPFSQFSGWICTIKPRRQLCAFSWDSLLR